MDTAHLILSGIAVLGIAVSHILIRHAMSSYATEKGKNLATKEDISEITHLIESTKISLQQRDRYEARRFDLKYQACLAALTIVDAQISHLIKSDNEGRPTEVDRQYATADEIRACHNGLILSVDNTEVVDTFITIITGGSKNAIEDMDRLRGLIRAELGFPGAVHKNEDKAWIAKSILNDEH